MGWWGGEQLGGIGFPAFHGSESLVWELAGPSGERGDGEKKARRLTDAQVKPPTCTSIYFFWGGGGCAAGPGRSYYGSCWMDYHHGELKGVTSVEGLLR